ncbi:MAG TPA: DUF3501 family protein [Polyangiaceae bacterium]|nr:DUF3501 family protein [Polyangiaceae bacterium]HMR79558.1 DUF3501 family protein [Polyangiaceae bacterium]
MKPVERNEVLALGAYEEIRDRFRGRIIEEKKRRRVALGSNMTGVFENHDTALYQIQEMLRTERISSEAAVAHEIETYNALVPKAHCLSFTLMVEYPEREERERMLSALAGLEDAVFLRVGQQRVAATSDERSDDKTRTTAVHYLRFHLGPQLTQALLDGEPAALLVEHAAYSAETPLSAATLQSLRADLSED